MRGYPGSAGTGELTDRVHRMLFRHGMELMRDAAKYGEQEQFMAAITNFSRILDDNLWPEMRGWLLYQVLRCYIGIGVITAGAAMVELDEASPLFLRLLAELDRLDPR